MKKISQGEFDLFTNKSNAIERFLQLQGVCNAQMSDESAIQFYCTKKGKITITNPPSRHYENENSTSLFAEVIEKNGKTYVSYYTVFDNLANTTKVVGIALEIIMIIIAIIFGIISGQALISILILVAAVIAHIVIFSSASREGVDAPIDSEILIKELEKRVEAVNLWDK